MPSPIAHTAVGLTLSVLGREKLAAPSKIGPLTGATAVSVMCSMLPDLDSALGILAGNFGRYHNNLTHSFFMATGSSLLVSIVIGWHYKVPRHPWFMASFLAYSLHILMDAANVGRGVMALWPFTAQRYKLASPLFYGFHWSDGLFSIRHFWTLVTELLFAVVVLWTAYRIQTWRGRNG